MDIQTFMITKIAEEAAELAQAASRIALWGKDSTNPKTGNTGLVDLMGELNDLGACIAFYERAAELHLLVHQLRAVEGGSQCFTETLNKIARLALKAYGQGTLELNDHELIELQSLTIGPL